MEQEVFSEQLRLTSSEPAARAGWIAGLGYVHAHYHEIQDVATSPAADGGNVDGLPTTTVT
jgi:hypothetical protein